VVQDENQTPEQQQEVPQDDRVSQAHEHAKRPEDPGAPEAEEKEPRPSIPRTSRNQKSSAFRIVRVILSLTDRSPIPAIRFRAFSTAILSVRD
jgi:hypothetical protein